MPCGALPSLAARAPCPSLQCSRRRWQRQPACPRAAASPSTSSSSPAAGKRERAEVRILRYPNGDERRIIYPATVAEAETEVEEVQWSIWTREDEDEATGWNECGLAGAACVVQEPDDLVAELASLQQRYAPAAPAHTLKERVRASYQILTGSPWLLPRPLFVLTQQSLTTGQASLYTLQTRLPEEGVTDELSRVLKRPALASSLSFSKMRDGVLAFDRAEDAARYATCLEADLGGEVDVMEVDSRQLFLLTGGADALVVHLPWSEFTPLPQQLAAALREGEQGGQATAL